MVPSTLKVPSPEHNPGNEIDEDLTADDLMSFQWQIACGMVRFQIFSYILLSSNTHLFLQKIISKAPQTTRHRCTNKFIMY